MKIILPLHVYVSKRKKFYFNLNVYRNAHYFELNKAKIAMKDQVLAAVVDAGLKPHKLKLTGPLKLIYTLYPQTRRRTDISNVLSIVDKFTADALVELGFLKDDDFHTVREVVYRFGIIDPDRPRVELEIDEFQGDPETEQQRTLF